MTAAHPNTRRTQDSRVCTAVRDTAAVGTIVWNPWKPPAQMWSSALPPASQIPLARATASSRNTSALPRLDVGGRQARQVSRTCRRRVDRYVGGAAAIAEQRRPSGLVAGAIPDPNAVDLLR